MPHKASLNLIPLHVGHCTYKKYLYISLNIDIENIFTYKEYFYILEIPEV